MKTEDGRVGKDYIFVSSSRAGRIRHSNHQIQVVIAVKLLLLPEFTCMKLGNCFIRQVLLMLIFLEDAGTANFHNRLWSRNASNLLARSCHWAWRKKSKALMIDHSLNDGMLVNGKVMGEYSSPEKVGTLVTSVRYTACGFWQPSGYYQTIGQRQRISDLQSNEQP